MSSEAMELEYSAFSEATASDLAGVHKFIYTNDFGFIFFCYMEQTMPLCDWLT
jgi:hypothetical protein